MQAGIGIGTGSGAAGSSGKAARGLRLELDGVSLVYQEGTPFASRALNGISLVIEPGQRLGIAGPVGSGKSTLLGVIAGMEAAASGRVLHDGRLVDDRNPPAPGSIGLAFQSPENCLFEKTVYDDVAFGPLHRVVEKDLLLVVRIPPKRDQVRVDDPVADLLLGNVLDVPEHLSGHLGELGEATAQIDRFHRA